MSQKLHEYVSSNNLAAIKELLLDSGSDTGVDLVNEYGQTPLTVSSWHGYQEVCRLLIERGANVDCRDKDGETPLHWSCGGGHSAIVKLLLESGASLNAVDHVGQTPLHWAASNDHIDVVRVLLDRGVDISVVNAEGEKPCDVARSYGIRKLLMELNDKYEDWEARIQPAPRVAVGFQVDESSPSDVGHSDGPLPYPAQLPMHSIIDATYQPPPYEIEYEDLKFGDRIGIGAFGEVFKADWRGTQVAVKRLIGDDTGRETFRKELDLMSNLRHPNIVQFLGGVTAPSYPMCLVTEHMSRGNLYDVLHSMSGPLPYDRLIGMAIDTAQGLAYLHTHTPPIMHRDLKSPNLLVDQSWTVKVADFGYTRVNEEAGVMSQCGTPQWMSPEMLRGEKYNEKSDVYSFGIVLWELITRRRPYEENLPTQVVGFVAYRLPGLRPIIPAGTPGHMASLIRDCWAEDPDFRPSFMEVLDRLRQCSVC